MSKIEWTDETWNPVAGCTKVSTGCMNCYAEKMAYRLSNIESTSRYKIVVNPKTRHWNGSILMHGDSLETPLRWKKPRKIFVCSMGDLFYDKVPFEWIDKVFSVTQKCPQHTFQILTKRPQRMQEYFKSRGILKPYRNVWLGVSAEDQNTYDKRINFLMRTPASVRFVSLEPLLGMIDMGYLPNHIIKWVIVGPETGPCRRKCDNSNILDIIFQCVVLNEIPVFVKAVTVDGKIEKDVSKFPDSYGFRNFPFEEAVAETHKILKHEI